MKFPKVLSFYLFLSLFILFVNFSLISQVPEDENYLKETISTKRFEDKKWAKLKKVLNYEDEAPIDEPANQSVNFSTPFSINSLSIKIIFFLVAIAALIFILLQLFKKPLNNNPSVNAIKYSIEKIEENLHELNLEDFLRNAFAQNNFRLAIRIYYLMVIKQLSNKNLIKWKKDKTNAEYLQEMRKNEDYLVFKELTLYFEYIWYSKKIFSEEQYLMVTNRFKAYIEKSL